MAATSPVPRGDGALAGLATRLFLTAFVFRRIPDRSLLRNDGMA